MDHPLFKRSNIVARRASIQNHIAQINLYIKPNGNEVYYTRNKNYLKHKKQIVFHIGKLKNLILNKHLYSKLIANYLVRVLSDNSQPNQTDYDNIKFLVNAFIVELFHFGYDFEYIKKIPDILLFSDLLNEFPFEKTISDFLGDKTKYQEYLKSEKKSMTMEKILNGLTNLINRPMKDGYLVFKIDDLSLQNPNPIQICNVVFYNPHISSMLNLDSLSELNVMQHKRVEYFYAKQDEAVLTNIEKESQCNAIIKVKFRPVVASKNTDSFYKAYLEVDKSLSILNHIINTHETGHKKNGKLDIKKHFYLHDNKRLAGYNTEIFWDNPKQVNITEENDIKFLNNELDFLNSLNLDSNLGKRLFDIICVRNKLKQSDELFNFKDLWITWESLIKREELKSLAKECYYIKYNINLITSVKIYLSSILKADEHFFSPTEYYLLSKFDYNNMSLEIEPFKKIATLKFSKEYKTLKQLLPIKIIEDIVDKIEEFITDKVSFFKKVDKWIDNTIDEVYIERNMEVHSGIQNELSKIKLRNDFIEISDTVFGFLTQFADKRDKNSLSGTIAKIKTRRKNI
ncbi:MAG: hypothetical protein IPO39_05865 [Bacteroidetes bacterium]|nr:hypothetical protein [Bacteroidota bacterium]